MALQPARWGQGARGGFRHGSWLPLPPSGAVVTLASPGHPRGPRSLQPCVLGLPAKLCPVWPAGRKAVRDEWPCSHHGDWEALSINPVMWRPIHESEDEWWVPGTDPVIGLPPGTGLV